jgi:hypothetical protein
MTQLRTWAATTAHFWIKSEEKSTSGPTLKIEGGTPSRDFDWWAELKKKARAL